MKTYIAENIRYYRKQMNISQTELSKRLFVQKNVISNYETGYRMPDIVTLCRLADIFDITLDELVEWEKE